ncbi:MAG: hypothetical protein GY851_18600 [bacterium]|nr:hypothetical protein [bacterium]
MSRNTCFRVRVRFAGLFAVLVLAGPARGMPEDELQSVYLRVVEQAVEAYEPLWRDYSDTIPDTGYFDISSYGNWRDDEYVSAVTIPLNGQLILCYSVLLNETDKDTFSSLKVPREVLRDHAIKAVRWCCLTSGYVENAHPYPIPGIDDHHLSGVSWIRKHGRPVDVLGWYTVGVANLWDELDEETRGLVQQLMVGSAAKEAYPYEWKYASGGHHDRIKQDMASTIGAAFLFPHVEEAKPCREVVAQQCMDMVATLHDAACPPVVDGRPVRDRYRAWHLYEDGSSDHHAWAQIWYGCDLIFEGRTYLELMSALTGQPPLEVYGYPGNGFDSVLDWVKGICLPEGEPASVHGMEYDSYYGAGLLAFCYGSVIRKDPVAAALEERAAKLLESHINAVQVYDYHRNSRAKAAAAYLMHKHAGPRAEPVPFEKAWESLTGTYHHRGHQNLVHRSQNAWVSFSWDSTSRKGRGPQGYVVPASLGEQDPLIYLTPHSIAGGVDMFDTDGKKQQTQPETLYTWNADDAGFCTTGRARDPWLDRYCAFFCFGDGPTVFIEALQARKDSQLSWAGVPVCFYARDGLTGPRVYRDAQGTFELGGAEEHLSDWWCVDERIGLAIAGGNKRAKIERRTGANWARGVDYRDKVDCVFASPIGRVNLKAGELGADIVAAIYPKPTPSQVAQASARLADGLVTLPEGWRGALVPDARADGRRYLAVSNLWGTDNQTVLELTCSEGGPVVTPECVVRNAQTRATVGLRPLESLGQAVDMYVRTPGDPVAVRRLGPGKYTFTSVNGNPVTIKTVYSTAMPNHVSVSLDPVSGVGDLSTTYRRDAILCMFTVTNETMLEFTGEASPDGTPPFVDIRDIDVREDGRVAVTVDANDQSGIAWVDLHFDGTVVKRKHKAPYTFIIRPEYGWHTFQATACDASPRTNTRASFKRTVEVRKP